MKFKQGIKKDFEAMRDKYADSLMVQGKGVIASKYVISTNSQLKAAEKAAERGAVKILTPTLDFMAVIKDESELLGFFLDYLKRNFILIDKKQKRSSEEMAAIAVFGAGDYVNNEQTLARYFGIDLVEAEKERSELLESIRNPHGEDGKDG